MPSSFKRLVRERQAKTGESYQTAARGVRAGDHSAAASHQHSMSRALGRGATFDHDDVEADEAVAVLKIYWPIGQRLTMAMFEWANCRGHTIGFLAMQTHLHETIASAQRAAAELPSEKIARLPCGVEIENAHRAYIRAQINHLARLSQWVERNAGALERHMRDRPLTEVWSEIRDKYPFDAPSDYAQIMNVERTRSLFQCGPANNVASINKVAARLLLGPDKPGGPLRVRSSQRLLAA